MAENKWVASSPEVWSAGSGWSLGHTPTDTEDVLFDGSGNGNCSLDQDATVGTLTATAYAGTFDDMHRGLCSLGVHLTPAVDATYVLNGLWTINGDADFIVDGTNGNMLGIPTIDSKGTGRIACPWYYLAYDPQIFLNMTPSVICSYPDKTTTWGGTGEWSYAQCVNLHLKGGQLHVATDTLYFALGPKDSSFSFQIDPGQIFTTDNPGADTNFDQFLGFKIMFDTTVAGDHMDIQLPAISAPTFPMTFSRSFNSTLPSGFEWRDMDATVHQMGDMFLHSLYAYGINSTNFEWDTNNYDTTLANNLDFEGYLSPAEVRFPVTLKCNNSRFDITGSSTFFSGNDLCSNYLDLGSSKWVVRGNTTQTSYVFGAWFQNVYIYPGMSEIRIIPSRDAGLEMGSQTNQFSFHDFIIEKAAGSVTTIDGGFNVDHLFSYDSSNTSMAWGDYNVNYIGFKGPDCTVILNQNLNVPNLNTDVTGQTITWDTSSNVLSPLNPGHIGNAQNLVTWKSAHADIGYKIEFPANTILGGINVSDCTNTGTLARFTEDTSIDGGDNTGLLFVKSNTFASPTVSDGVPIVSTINRDALVSLIQQHQPDTYFDTTSEIKQVYVYYTSDDTRQFQYALFEGNPLIGTFQWESGAKDGTWAKNKIVVLGANNTKTTLVNMSLDRLFHSDGTMSLTT